MKFLEKVLLIGIMAAVAYFFGLKNRPSAGVPAAGPTMITPVATPVRTAAAVANTVGATAPVSQFDQTMTWLHSKICQCQESETNDPDNEIGRERCLREMLARVTDENVAEIIQTLSAEEMKTPFGIGVLHHWMLVDPVAASNWLGARPETTEDQTLTVATDWAGKPEGLKQYLDQLPDTAWKQSFIQDASSALQFKDPAAAVKLAQQMKPGAAQTNLLRAVACGWVSKDPNATLDWITGVTDPVLREQLTAAAAQSYAVTDPALAATWLVQEVKSDGLIKDSALNILNTWVTTDPAAAADWAAQFPDGQVKASAIEIVANHWQQTDPEAATAWIQNLAGNPADATY